MKSGVIKILRTSEGLFEDLSLVLFFRIIALSWILFRDSFSNLGLVDFLPRRRALFIVVKTPRYVWSKVVHLEISSFFLDAPSEAVDSSMLCYYDVQLPLLLFLLFSC